MVDGGAGRSDAGVLPTPASQARGGGRGLGKHSGTFRKGVPVPPAPSPAGEKPREPPKPEVHTKCWKILSQETALSSSLPPISTPTEATRWPPAQASCSTNHLRPCVLCHPGPGLGPSHPDLLPGLEVGTRQSPPHLHPNPGTLEPLWFRAAGQTLLSLAWTLGSCTGPGAA